MSQNDQMRLDHDAFRRGPLRINENVWVGMRLWREIQRREGFADAVLRAIKEQTEFDDNWYSDDLHDHATVIVEDMRIVWEIIAVDAKNDQTDDPKQVVKRTLVVDVESPANS